MIQVTALSRDLKIYLLEHRGKHLFVESINQNSIHLVDEGGRLVVFTKFKDNLGPMSLSIDPWERTKSLQLGDHFEINFQGMTLAGEKMILDEEEVELYNPSIYFRKIEEHHDLLKERYKKMHELLIKEGDHHGLLSLIDSSIPSNTYCNFIETLTRDFLTSLKEKRIKEALSLVSDFIGFGPGTTPSTDDFLTGVLLSLYFLTHYRNTEEYTPFFEGVGPSILGKTIRSSEQMLLHSVKGKAKENYKDIIMALFSPKSNELEPVVKKSLEMEALSTSDFLTGVYLVKDIVLRAYSKEG